MAKIKYAVVGIDQTLLGNLIGNLIGTLARGEVAGEPDTIVLDAPIPMCYRISDSPGQGASTVAQEVPFSKYLGEAVTKERRRLVKASQGEQVIKDVVEQLTSEQGVE